MLLLTYLLLGLVVPTSRKLVGPHEQGSSVGPDDMSPQEPDDVDLQSVYSQFCFLAGDNSTVVIQNTQRLSAIYDLFHTVVVIQDTVKLRAMRNSGSMACSLSARALPLLKQNDVVPLTLFPPLQLSLSGVEVQEQTLSVYVSCR